MIGTIRKHQTWLWGVIITVTIISFVIFFNPSNRVGNANRGQANYGSFNGVRISDEEFTHTRNEVLLSHLFMKGSWPDNNYDPMQDIYQRLFLIRKAQDMGIEISADSVAQSGRELVKRLEQMRISSPEMFVDQVLRPQRMSWDDFERFVRHDITIQQFISTMGMCGKLITPQEAKELYTREHQELATEIVFFTGSNYLAEINPTPEAVSNYWSLRQSEYRIPERIQVAYVKFALSNFQAEAEQELAKSTNLDANVEQAYKQDPTNVLRELKAVSLEDAKVKYRERQVKGFETKKCADKARVFGRELYERNEKQPGGATNLMALAKEKELVSGISTPFDLKDGPKELNVSASFAEAAFALGTNDFSRPQLGEDAVYIVAVEKRIPSEQPPFEQVREKVEADYKYNQALGQARIRGQLFATVLTNSLAQGKTMADVCAEQKVTSITLPPFSLSTRELPPAEEHVTLNQLKQIAFTTGPSNASPFQPTLGGGLVLYVKTKMPISEAKLKDDLPGFTSYVRQARQNEAFNEWFRKESERGAFRDTPLQQRQQQQQGGQRANRSS